MSQIGDMYKHIHRFASNPSYSVFVDIGVRSGGSSVALSDAARKTGGKVFGIDYDYCDVDLPKGLYNYTILKGESVTLGRSWMYERPDFVFIDATHVKEWLMCELYYWWDLLQVGGTMGFHDTNWVAGRHDIWCGKSYATVDQGLMEFFQLPATNDRRVSPTDQFRRSSLDYEDDNIRCVNIPEGDGLTFILKKTGYDYKAGVRDWTTVFGVRKDILKCILTYGKDASDYCDGSGIVSEGYLELEIDPTSTTSL